jgi:hypothetical protein
MRTERVANVWFALPIFLGAFLLFQVQPLIAKFVLPWFGGATSVWTTCMLFFQAALLAGYAYAHALGRISNLRTQLCIHLVCVAIAFLFLPLRANAAWKPVPGEDPTWRLFGLLAAAVGVPYAVLAATSPLIQAWHSRVRAGEPYRLYALSNVGSLLALVSFPFVFEPVLNRIAIANFWTMGFVLFAVSIAGSAVVLWRRESPPSLQTDVDVPAEAISTTVRLLWVLLPACASALLLATTNKICQDIAVIPFLWVLPLSLYLLSFIVCFDSPLWYSRMVFGGALVVFTGLSCYALMQGPTLPIVLQIGIYSGALFAICMVLHGELYRLRPPPRRLTGYYLTIALGGALGGAFVALLAPVVFKAYLELHWGMLAAVVLLVVVHVRERTAFRVGRVAVPIWTVLATGLIVLGGTLFMQMRIAESRVIESARNFYGVLRVFEYGLVGTESHVRRMNSGEITHGEQFVWPWYERLATTYYHELSGVGLTFRAIAERASKRIGAVGLGTGTLASYVGSNDVIRFYEINPAVKRLTDRHFTYLANATGKVDVVFGDARLSLERERKQNYDVLVLDAFSGDAVPVHLLTKEAFEIYMRHLNTNGVLAVHITNRHLELGAVVRELAQHFGLKSIFTSYVAKASDASKYSCRWVLLTRATNLLDTVAIKAATIDAPARPVKMWTDDYASLLPLIYVRED